MARELPHQVDQLIVGATAYFTSRHDELDPVPLRRELWVLVELWETFWEFSEIVWGLLGLEDSGGLA